jgi:hypothetical protein
MDKLVVKKELLPSRCEICHQADSYDPKINLCKRCNKVSTNQASMSKDILSLSMDCFSKVIFAVLFLVIWYCHSLCVERQQVLKVIKSAIVYDEWDQFGSKPPKAIATLRKDTELKVLGVHRSMEGGGIKVKLDDGRIGYAHLFEEYNEDIEWIIVKKTDYISIISLFIMVISFIKLWFTQTINKRVLFLKQLVWLAFSTTFLIILSQGWL